MVMYGYAWLCIPMYPMSSYVRLCRDMYVYVELCMAMSGYV